MRHALFDPLEIAKFSWERDPKGHCQGMTGLQITAQDLAKIGRLVAGGGSWNGVQLLPNLAQVSAATTPGSPYPSSDGLLWWRLHDTADAVVGSAALGYLGQQLVVLPGLDVVAVRQKHYVEGENPEDVSFHSFVHEVAASVGLNIPWGNS